MLLQVPLGLDSCEGPACKRAKLALEEHEVDLDMASMCLPLLGRSWCASSPDTVARAVAAEVGVVWCASGWSAAWRLDTILLHSCWDAAHAHSPCRQEAHWCCAEPAWV